MSFHKQMFLAFVIGIVAGLAVNFAGAEQAWVQGLIHYITGPIGQLFLSLLKMLVVPLVFSALLLGVVEIGDPQSLGRIGLRTLAWIVLVTGIAVAIGLVMVNLFKPGVGLPPDMAQSLIHAGASQSGDIAGKATAASPMAILLNLVPTNPVAAAANGDLLALMVVALLFGIAAAVSRSEGVKSFVGAVQGVYDISLLLIDWVIRMAPYAVAALLFNLTARLGMDVIVQLSKFVFVVVAALALHLFVVFPILLRTLGGVSPWWFFRQAEPAMLTAFSTSSSSATLPTTLQVAEESLMVPRRIGRFVCTLGATANMNGTALFEGITVIFLAQFFGVHLGLTQQALVLAICILGGVGAAGVPGGSLPVIVMVLGMFGIPPEGIGIVLGVDRFLDMCRTCVNVTGDLAGAVVIGRFEPATEPLAEAPA